MAPIASQPRFVVLYHQFDGSSEGEIHWDLMIEQENGLMTWRLSEIPEPGKTISAERLPDHRLAYLNYEGPVSGGRGQVSRVMQGFVRIIGPGRWELVSKQVGSMIAELNQPKMVFQFRSIHGDSGSGDSESV